MEIINQESVFVKIGFINLYCESFKAEVAAAFVEQPSVNGDSQITNKFKKATKLTFKGRVYDEGNPMYFIAIANNTVGLPVPQVRYREINLSNCILTGFSAEESGNGILNVTITLATKDVIVYKAEEQQ